MKKKFLIIISAAITTISCQSEKDKQLNEKSLLTFNSSVEKIKKTDYEINVDSFRVVYEENKSENAQKGIDFADKFENYSNRLLKEKIKIDSIKEIQKNRVAEYRKNTLAKEQLDWENSKYGKLQKKYPEWNNDECKKVINKEIWIGMKYQMLIYQRGKPNTINPSNYGNGKRYQYCWDDYKPSCFYSLDDQIITSYN